MSEKCVGCGKNVYFAEKKTSYGKAYHPLCLKCNECGKRLNPGGHSEHDGKPYCDVPCYGALFGPRGFGRGGVESHNAFGNRENKNTEELISENQLIRDNVFEYNKRRHGNSGLGPQTDKPREVNNKIIVHLRLPVYWEVDEPILFGEECFFLKKGLQKRVKKGNAFGKKGRASKIEPSVEVKTDDLATEEEMHVNEFIPPEGMVVHSDPISTVAVTPHVWKDLFQRCDIKNFDVNAFELWEIVPSTGYSRKLTDTDCPLAIMFKYKEDECHITLRLANRKPKPAPFESPATRPVAAEPPPLTAQVVDSPPPTTKFSPQMSVKRMSTAQREVAIYGNLSIPELQQFIALFDMEQKRETIKCKERWLRVKQRLLENLEQYLAIPDVKGRKVTGKLTQEEFIKWRIKKGVSEYERWRNEMNLPPKVWFL